MKQILLLAAISTLFITAGHSQSAELHIKNNSQRTMSIKVMSSEGHKFSSATVYPWSEEVFYFRSTGSYYLKTKATIQGKEPMYSKGKPFRVYVGSDSYSVLTITYTIKEVPNSEDPLSGKKISKEEFERD
jgi:hypothetical protein